MLYFKSTGIILFRYECGPLSTMYGPEADCFVLCATDQGAVCHRPRSENIDTRVMADIIKIKKINIKPGSLGPAGCFGIMHCSTFGYECTTIVHNVRT